MRVKALSDTHCFHLQEPLDPVDALIHCGDATNSKNLWVNEQEFWEFFNWWEASPATYKIFVPGNHDMFCETSKFNKFVKNLNKPNFHFLIDKVVDVEGVVFYGTPYTPRFHDWAFNVDKESLHKHYKPIKEGVVDVVISHGPPKFILDHVPRSIKLEGVEETINLSESAGCMSLAKAIDSGKPKHVFFGHIHGSNKFENNGTLIRGETQYHNCSQVLDNMLSYGLFYNGKILEI